MCNVADKDFCIQEHVKQDFPLLFELAFGDEKKRYFRNYARSVL